MHIHILGICGTFMGSLAVLASELNYKVTGSDQNVYPPMSTQLAAKGIDIIEGYEASQLDLKPDCVIVGNVMRRGMPVIEALLESDLPFLSGPVWLKQEVLRSRHVLAVSGTHGKTTTASMLAFILEYAGLNPGLLIGGVPNNFGISARLSQSSKYFVIEADEYDSAFFDKRSKFVHYWPRTLIINNIEFDHADIFKDLAAIQQQFHHLLRLLPQTGMIIHPKADANVDSVLKMGCWSKTENFDLSYSDSGFTSKKITGAGDRFEVYFKGKSVGEIQWSLLGDHNILNALAAIAAAAHIEISPSLAIEALCKFQGVKRRLELKGHKNGIAVYEDFAHHPTAIKTTLAGLRAKVGENARIIAIVDIRSNTMRLGHHKHELPGALKEADEIYFYKSSQLNWDIQALFQTSKKLVAIYNNAELLMSKLLENRSSGDQIIFMSNGGFSGVAGQFFEKMWEI